MTAISSTAARGGAASQESYLSYVNGLKAIWVIDPDIVLFTFRDSLERTEAYERVVSEVRKTQMLATRILPGDVSALDVLRSDLSPPGEDASTVLGVQIKSNSIGKPIKDYNDLIARVALHLPQRAQETSVPIYHMHV